LYGIQQVGWYDSEHTGSSGQTFGEILFLTPGAVGGGYSYRILGVSTLNGHDAWAWNGASTLSLGFTGGAFRSQSGKQNTTIVAHNDLGLITGFSERFVNVSTSVGADAWVFDGTTNTAIGFTGGVYTTPSGAQTSLPKAMSSSGLVVGTSARYTGETPNGADAWMWDGTSTTQLGFTGNGFEGSAGYRNSLCQFVNGAGRAAGSSTRVSGVQTITGAYAWFWDGMTLTRLGLTGGRNTSSSGSEASAPLLMNEAGQVVGRSTRYNGTTILPGGDAWVWQGGATIQVGFTGGVYFDAYRGLQNSTVQFQNAAGQLAGTSDRYYPNENSNGASAWVWNGSTTMQIGLLGLEYFGSDGYHLSSVVKQNQAGQIAGATARVTGQRDLNGTDTWVWNGTTTTQIGLTGGIYTTAGGKQINVIEDQNEAGFIVGHVSRAPNLSNGLQDLWQWDGATTRLIGPPVTSNGPYYSNRFIAQNAAGQVIGWSQLISPAQDVWVYDPITHVSTVIVHNARASDGYTQSNANILANDGTVYGTYAYFDHGVPPASCGNCPTGENRAFLYRTDQGFVELAGLIGGGLAGAGWSAISSPELATSSGTLLGKGTLVAPQVTQAIYAMVPAGCRADHNADGTLAVNDIFQFLNDWFAGLPNADFDGMGGLQVADVFAFLNAWFAGCP
jgi:hypothetical protein